MKNTPLEFIDEVIVRSPIYPYNNDKSLEDVLALLDDNFFLEALYIASPLLYDECMKLKAGDLKTAKEKTKVVNSLHRYITRMTTRSTPFGLFSTCGVAVWDNDGSSQVEAAESFSRHTRLDMHLLYNLLSSIISQPDIQRHLKYFPNSSRYVVGTEVRYIEYVYKNGLRKYKISGVTHNQYVEKVLRHSQAGITRDELTALIASGPISQEQSSGFITDLINSQLLVSDFEVALTSPNDFAQQIKDTLQQLFTISGGEAIKHALDFFAAIIDDLKVLDSNAVNSIVSYRSIIEKLKAYYPEVKEARAFHIDSYRHNTNIRINVKVKGDLLQLLHYLKSLNADAYNTDEPMQAFKRMFLQRYESQTMLLVDVLDHDFGIGYPVNKKSEAAYLVDDITFNIKVRESTIRLSAKDKWLLTILRDHKNKDAQVIELDKQTIPTYNADDTFRGVPPTFSAMFRVTNKESETILFEGFFGPSGAPVLGRFAHGNPEIKRVIEKIVLAEESVSENCVFAEIVHMPDNRITNIIKHPIFRKYEIPYLAKTSVHTSHVIELNDLFVKVENDEIVLFSKRFNKRIIPCKTHMHNIYNNTLPLYHFLGSLQSQGIDRSINFSWGNLMQLFTFLPRVCYKKIIVSPAMWSLNPSAFAHFNKASGEILHLVAQLREEFKLPRKVLYSEGDNELLVDFSDVISVETWLSLIKNKPSILLKEFLWAEDVDENTHLHQYIATIVNKEKRRFTTPELARSAHAKTVITRDFPMGSEWLYLKLYCGPGSVDMLLSKLIAPVIKGLNQQELIIEWFYIKYRDPEFHLRLRIRLKQNTDAQRVFGFINHFIAESQMHSLIWKTQLDTYSREIERYGAQTIALCETIFWIDSKSAIELLGTLSNDENEVLKFLWSLRLTDEILNASEFDLERKRAFVELARKSFQVEFGTNKNSMDSINFKYTTYKEQIASIMGEHIEGKYPKIAQIIQRKMSEMTPLLQEVIRLQKEHALENDSFRVMSSIIHMMLNRLITQKERTHELLIYEFLSKYYTTQHFLNK